MNDPNDPISARKRLDTAKSHLDLLEFAAAREVVHTVLIAAPGDREAQALLKEIDEREKSSSDPSLSPQNLYQQSMDELNKGNLSAALGKISKVLSDFQVELEEHPSGSPRLGESAKQSYIDKIRDCLREGNIADAEVHLSLGLLDFPNDTDIDNLRKEVRHSLERKKNLDELLQQVHGLLQEMKYEEAIPLLEEQLQLANNDIVRRLLTEALLSCARNELPTNSRKARQLLERALSLDAGNTEAKVLYQTWAERNRELLVEEACKEARDLQAQGQLQQADRLLRRALDQVPGEPRLLSLAQELSALIAAEREQAEVRDAQMQAAEHLASKRFSEADQTVRQTLGRYPNSAILLDLLEQVERGRRTAMLDEIVGRTQQQTAALEHQGTVPALFQAQWIVAQSLKESRSDPRLLDLKIHIEKRLKAVQVALSSVLLRVDEAAALGQYRSAMEFLEEAVRLDPEDAELRARERQLRKASLLALWNQHRKTILIGAGALSLALITVFLIMRLFPRKPEPVNLAINSSPQKAKVLINGEYKGLTPLELPVEVPRSGLQVTVRLELQNYEVFAETVSLWPGQPLLLAPRLKLTDIAAELGRLGQIVEEALANGSLLEPIGGSAVDFLTQMKEIDPGDQMGRGKHLLERVKTAFKDKRDTLISQKRDSEQELDLLEQFSNRLEEPFRAWGDSEGSSVASRIEELKQLVQRRYREIDAAIASRKLFSSEKDGALTLVKWLERRFATREGRRLEKKKDEIRGTILELARQKCVSATQECTNFVETALRDFPNDQNLTSLRPTGAGPAPAPNVKLEDSLAALLKAARLGMESSWDNKQYVLPRDQSVVKHANEILKHQKDDVKALDMKAAAKEEAEKQAGSLSGRGQVLRAIKSVQDATDVKANLTQAQNIYAAIHDFWPSDARPSQQSKELADRMKEVDRLLSPRGYQVIHDHKVFRDCRGELIVSGHFIRYKAEGEKDSHGFDKNFEDLQEARKDKQELQLVFPDKKYEFKTKSETESVDGIWKQIDDLMQVRKRLAGP